jgi:DNA repair protein RadC
MKYQILSERTLRNTVKIKDPTEVYKLVKRYTRLRQECFLLLTLNGSHSVISVSVVGIGLANKTISHPREVFFKAINDNAVAIIICHNHPSGDTAPSEEDKRVTSEIYKAGEVIGIRLLDHIIISKKGFTSLKSQGIFPWERR